MGRRLLTGVLVLVLVGEVLVRVAYASLYPVDWKIAAGKFRFLVKGGLPRTMGSDYSGEIAAVGPGVDGWSPGDPVMGFVDPFARAAGTFAEYVPVPVGFVTRRPQGVDEVLGAALPCVGVTAVALCDLAQVGRGSSVLVNGASGGVGHLAVQVAKVRGALVAATASAGRREFVTALPAAAAPAHSVTAPPSARRLDGSGEHAGWEGTPPAPR